MAIRVGINGFGRIGRNIMRAAMGNKEFDFVAVNDITDTKTLAHLLKYDSILGQPRRRRSKPATAGSASTATSSRCCRRRIPAALPWKDLGVDVVFEGTGKFTKRDDAAKHIAAGAKRVIITAPATGPDGTFVMGVNHEQYDPAKHVDHLERVLHDELPGAVRQGAERLVRHREGLDDDHPLLHERPERCSTCRTRTCAARARPRCR